MRSGFILCLVISALLAADSANAIIDPQILKDDRDRASEKLVLNVLKVTVVGKGLSRKVTAKAKVQLVRQSRTGLTKGDKITIQYTSRLLPRRASGPKPIPIIAKGEIGAFLHGSKGMYFPAARSMSFVSAKKMRTLKTKPAPRKRSRTIRRPDRPSPTTR